MTKRINSGIFGVGLLVALTVCGTAQGAMLLTAAGTAAGFTLSTFADGFPFNGGGVGPVGIMVTPGGKVIVSSYATGRNAVFATDTDGQTFAGATLSTTLFGAGNPTGIARVGTHYYQGMQGIGRVYEIDEAGNFVADIVGVGLATGVTANPTNGHIFVSNPAGAVFDVDPLAMTSTLFKAVAFDGMTINSAGTILYGANLSNGHVEGYFTSDGSLAFDSGFIPGGIDGSALGSGSLAGKIYVVTNGGTIVEVDLITKVQVLIASGGSRGDLVEVDPLNGTLLLTQSDRVLRLTGPDDGGFGDPTTVPEPATLAIWGLGALGCAFAARRRRAK